MFLDNRVQTVDITNPAPATQIRASEKIAGCPSPFTPMSNPIAIEAMPTIIAATCAFEDCFDRANVVIAETTERIMATAPIQLTLIGARSKRATPAAATTNSGQNGRTLPFPKVTLLSNPT